MVNPTLIAAALRAARRARGAGARSRRRAPCCWSSCAPTTRPSSTGSSSARSRRSRTASCCERARASPATAEETEVFWRVREGMQGIVGAMRPQGTALIIEDVCVPPARIAESARDIQALLGKHGFLTGVAGHASAGNLHFLLTPSSREPADRDRYESFMTRAGRADRGQVRRLAEGRARHRAQHGALRRARVGAEGDRADVADQAARRSRRRARTPTCVLSRDAERPPARPQVDAADRGRRQRQRVHRVRLLRAGLPEPRPDDDAAPADRAAPRDGAPARGLAGAARRWSSSTRYDGEQTCAADGTLPARLPGRRSTPAS